MATLDGDYRIARARPIVARPVVFGRLEVVDQLKVSFLSSFLVSPYIDGEEIVFVIYHMIFALVLFVRDIPLVADMKWLGDLGRIAAYLFDGYLLLLVHPNGGSHGFCEAQAIDGLLDDLPHSVIHDVLDVLFFQL